MLAHMGIRKGVRTAFGSVRQRDGGAGPRDLRAAFSGAMLLNCTRDRQPTKPGVLYFVMRTGSISPVSADDGTEIDR